MMSNLITRLNPFKDEPRVEVRQITLDNLWQEASSLGRIEIDEPIFSKEIRVTIKFETPRGSVVHAKASGADVYIAFQCALSEAYELGAVPKKKGTRS